MKLNVFKDKCIPYLYSLVVSRLELLWEIIVLLKVPERIKLFIYDATMRRFTVYNISICILIILGICVFFYQGLHEVYLIQLKGPLASFNHPNQILKFVCSVVLGSLLLLFFRSKLLIIFYCYYILNVFSVWYHVITNKAWVDILIDRPWYRIFRHYNSSERFEYLQLKQTELLENIYKALEPLNYNKLGGIANNNTTLVDCYNTLNRKLYLRQVELEQARKVSFSVPEPLEVDPDSLWSWWDIITYGVGGAACVLFAVACGALIYAHFSTNVIPSASTAVSAADISGVNFGRFMHRYVMQICREYGFNYSDFMSYLAKQASVNSFKDLLFQLYGRRRDFMTNGEFLAYCKRGVVACAKMLRDSGGI